MIESKIPIGRFEDLSHTRYALYLSNGNRLVLFRLPRIGGSDYVRQEDGLHITSKPEDWVLYAMEAECPHAGGPMTQAHIDIEDSSYIASCPWHEYDFNVETGESKFGIKTCTFPVKVESGNLVFLYITAPNQVHLLRSEPVNETVKFRHKKTERNKQSLDLTPNATLCEWCIHILNTSDPEQKIELTTQLFSIFSEKEKSHSPMDIGSGNLQLVVPDKPRREHRKGKLLDPGSMPRAGKGGSPKSRIMMLHNLANIEQWAIDLAIDICVRFATFQTDPPTTSSTSTEHQPKKSLPRTFFYDWLKVAYDEAKHFSLLRTRLEELGSYFGEFPVHDGLWRSAILTAHDLRARISVIALVHEARGLDVNPMTIRKFRDAGDLDSVSMLEIIHNDEITHVTTGHRWLSWICEQESKDPVQVFRDNVKKYFFGAVKGPFNVEARNQTGLTSQYYEGLASDNDNDKNIDIIAGG